ncbi:MAG: 1,4-dihydroxy-6-naphthoate synthase [Saprospiraceae bacterium]|uniref:1,4-dihydroxy-6-naphtoate synthase n=1 Tax=Candidatus Opimibacter skivensis TaxID=2982028 RepID=A0A9D7SVU0_9BACT|nr:1,4-dihydroxy-6-naphthoate synthase [Candidatus Opimibacter skivensis]
MNITLGFSPCPNDTFMFAALVNGWIDTKGLSFTVLMEDVETLNEWAASTRLDVTKMSFHRSLSLLDQYTLLQSGAALGNGCGPLLISNAHPQKEDILAGPVLLPGNWTTAHLLFNIFYPGCLDKQFVVFNEIEEMLLQDKAVAGVIIHENRFTYEALGLHKVMDLGEAWETKTGLPIPLGGIFTAHHISDEIRSSIETLIKESIQFGYLHPEIVMPYVRQFSQTMDEEVMKSHIKLYVNDFSLDLGEKGRESIRILKKMSL